MIVLCSAKYVCFAILLETNKSINISLVIEAVAIFLILFFPDSIYIFHGISIP